MSETIEQKCQSQGVKLTDQRRIIAKVISESKKAYGESDHPDVDELYNRVSKIDPKISIATVYRTVKLFEEAGILTKHDFKGGKARYEINDVSALLLKQTAPHLLSPIELCEINLTGYCSEPLITICPSIMIFPFSGILISTPSSIVKITPEGTLKSECNV